MRLCTVKHILHCLTGLLLLATAASANRNRGIWCGDRNCYDVLGVKESASSTTIINAYRKLAREWHPDKNAHRRREAERTFAEVAHAYDILKNNVSRRDYDYALKHPEEFAYNYYRYYYSQYYVKHAKLNPVLVVMFGLCMWSAFEYMSRSITHKQAIAEFKRSPEYKQNLKRLKEDTLADMERKGLVKRKMNGKRTRKEIDAVEVDETILEDQIVVRGSYRKPKLSELAIVQVWLLPWYAYKAIRWQIGWIYKYQIKQQEYSQEDKVYLTRTFFSISADTWEGLEAKTKAKLMGHEVWDPANEKKVREMQKEQARRMNSMDDFDPD